MLLLHSLLVKGKVGSLLPWVLVIAFYMSLFILQFPHIKIDIVYLITTIELFQFIFIFNNINVVFISQFDIINLLKRNMTHRGNIMKKTTILLATALTVTLAFNASSVLISGTANAISANIGTDASHTDNDSKAASKSNESTGEYAGLATYNESATIER